MSWCPGAISKASASGEQEPSRRYCFARMEPRLSVNQCPVMCAVAEQGRWKQVFNFVLTRDPGKCSAAAPESGLWAVEAHVNQYCFGCFALELLLACPLTSYLRHS